MTVEEDKALRHRIHLKKKVRLKLIIQTNTLARHLNVQYTRKISLRSVSVLIHLYLPVFFTDTCSVEQCNKSSSNGFKY